MKNQTSISFQELVDRTNEISRSFPRQYDTRDHLIDLVEEVGELAQAMQISLGRKYSNDPIKQKTKEDVVDALGDILFEVIRLARIQDIDLVEEYPKILDQLEARVKSGEFDQEERSRR
jgi:NTP pyrophosphatase (non-canonical NTP hydrolase)